MRSLSDLVIVAWNISAAEALSANFEFILREHFLIALTELDKLTGITARKLNFNSVQVENVKTESAYLDKIFLKAGINKKNLRRKLRQILGEGKETLHRGGIHRDKNCHEVFAKAQSFAENARQTNGIDLLKAILTFPTQAIEKVLREQKESVVGLMKVAGEIEHKARVENPAMYKPKPYIAPPDIDKILTIGSNLVEKASQGLVRECIGRKNYIRKILNDLKRKTAKKNILLLGQKGIGKTAIVETVALMIYKRQVAEALENATIIDISPEKFSRLKDSQKISPSFFGEVINQARNRSEIILHFENIDDFLGGNFKGGKEFIGEILGEVSSGNLRIMASADRKSLAANIKGFSGIFETIEIKEVSTGELLEILKFRKSDYELQYDVKIIPSALNAVVNLTNRFKLPGVFPQKALDILETSCVKASLPVEKQDESALNQITRAAKKFNLDLQPDVNEVWVAHSVSRMLGMNIFQVAGYLASGCYVRFSEMKSKLQKKVLGQEQAISKIVQRIKTSFASRIKSKDPIMFLFVGPHGVGKTEIARHIPHYVFAGNCEVVFFDMKQFNTNDRIRRLFGVDGQVGILEQVLRENPFQVFLFENIEHSAKSFYNEFQAFVRNFELDLSRSVFVLTSAALAFAWSDVGHLSEGAIISRAVRKLPRFFPRGFLDKVANIIMFKSIGEKENSELMADWIDEKRAQVFEKLGVKIRVSPSVEKILVSQGTDREFGVRGLRVAFEDLFAGVIDSSIERNQLTKSKNWQFKIIEGRTVLEPVVTAKK